MNAGPGGGHEPPDDLDARAGLQAERDRLRAELERSRRMEALGQLAAGIAHDFNNILGAVLGYSTLALERHVPDRQGKLAAYLREVISAGERARDLIAQTLTHSGARAGDAPAGPVDAAPVLTAAAKLLAASIPAPIQVVPDLAARTPAVGIAAVDLFQVVMALALNARDALGENPDGGRIGIGLRELADVEDTCAACGQPARGRFVEVSVSDNGRGIAPAHRGRVFEPFFSRKPAGEGAGLGLSTVERLVHGAGGHVLIESQPGAGTTVRVLLPRPAPRDETPAAAAPAATASAGGGRILVVDDEPMLLDYLRELLDSCGHTVTAMSSPLAALERFEQDPRAFDLLVTDQSMPGLSGVTLARALRERRPGLPVILCSGFADAVDAATARSLGLRAVMLKPVAAEDLLAAIDAALRETGAA